MMDGYCATPLYDILNEGQRTGQNPGITRGAFVRWGCDAASEKNAQHRSPLEEAKRTPLVQ
jgi:hypothetical protein